MVSILMLSDKRLMRYVTVFSHFDAAHLTEVERAVT